LFSFKFLSFFDVEHCVLGLREISGDEFVCLLPLVGDYIHFKGFNVASRLDEVLLCKVELADICIMMSDFSVERSSDFFWLALNELDCCVPLFCFNGSFNSFYENSSLFVVRNC